MNQIITQTSKDLGIRQAKFYTFQGEVPVQMLNFIDVLNTVLDLPSLNDDQVMLLAKFVMYEFSTLTILEIEKAVFMAKAGKFEGCNSSDYNKLGIDFLGRVLKAYSDEKKKQELIKQPMIEDKKNYCCIDEPKEVYELFVEMYKDKSSLKFGNWNYAFYYMERNGIINLDIDEKKTFFETVYYDIKDEINENRKKRKNSDILIRIISDRNLLAAECRKRLVQKHFDNQG